METAAIEVAVALAAAGHEVEVFGNVVREEALAGVAWRPRGAFDPRREYDALVGVGGPELFESRPAASRTVLWVHDPDAWGALTPERAAAVDAIAALSSWHAERLRLALPEAADKVAVVENGLGEGFAPAGGGEPLVAFTSAPERGLDVLLELWPRIRAEVPEARLQCTHAPVYSELERVAPRLAGYRQRVRELADQPGVEVLGAVPRERLARLLGAARVWVNPSWSSPWDAPFLECSCIAALEAQAAGAWPVASAWGALPETLRVGELVPALDAPGEAWRRALVAAIVRGLHEPGLAQRAGREGPLAVKERSWQRTAQRLGRLAGL